ncbi:hypothetical protein BGX31_006331 [Mortierella sp. GBA43]|nr:hypothetical protein BGX31_006331 [Mortierella sp. GBA43]
MRTFISPPEDTPQLGRYCGAFPVEEMTAISFYRFQDFKHHDQHLARYLYRHVLYRHATTLCQPDITRVMRVDWSQGTLSRRAYWDKVKSREDRRLKLETYISKLADHVMEQSVCMSKSLVMKVQREFAPLSETLPPVTTKPALQETTSALSALGKRPSEDEKSEHSPVRSRKRQVITTAVESSNPSSTSGRSDGEGIGEPLGVTTHRNSREDRYYGRIGNAITIWRTLQYHDPHSVQKERSGMTNEALGLHTESTGARGLRKRLLRLDDLNKFKL